MRTKPVKIARWPDKHMVDGFEYVVVAANGHGIAVMCKKGISGLDDALAIHNALNKVQRQRQLS